MPSLALWWGLSWVMSVPSKEISLSEDVQTVDAIEKNRFTGAIGANDGEDLTFSDSKLISHSA